MSKITTSHDKIDELAIKLFLKKTNRWNSDWIDVRNVTRRKFRNRVKKMILDQEICPDCVKLGTVIVESNGRKRCFLCKTYLKEGI